MFAITLILFSPFLNLKSRGFCCLPEGSESTAAVFSTTTLIEERISFPRLSVVTSEFFHRQKRSSSFASLNGYAPFIIIPAELPPVLPPVTGTYVSSIWQLISFSDEKTKSALPFSSVKVTAFSPSNSERAAPANKADGVLKAISKSLLVSVVLLADR